MNIKNLKVSFELVLRQCVFIILNIYAIRKLFGGQFYRNGELPADVAKITLGEVDSFTIAWVFMGYSFWYVLFIGITQLIGAWFLLWSKTKLIGVMILIPIMLNIIMFDLIFLGVYSALAISIITFLMLIMIILFNKEKIINIYQELITFLPKSEVLLKEKILTVGITIMTLLLTFSFCYLIERLTWVT
ncbi:hypothetical protein [uncultured Maribacter sp.]|uniref:hypothetical protein n=1 Tax=uncultured Maribacter sp. TaxID=431308 RepID=UPI00263A37D3|nr:hypothetical protein [uncultured Maribacter sp.]